MRQCPVMHRQHWSIRRGRTDDGVVGWCHRFARSSSEFFQEATVRFRLFPTPHQQRLPKEIHSGREASRKPLCARLSPRLVGSP